LAGTSRNHECHRPGFLSFQRSSRWLGGGVMPVSQEELFHRATGLLSRSGPSSAAVKQEQSSGYSSYSDECDVEPRRGRWRRGRRSRSRSRRRRRGSGRSRRRRRRDSAGRRRRDRSPSERRLVGSTPVLAPAAPAREAAAPSRPPAQAEPVVVEPSQPAVPAVAATGLAAMPAQAQAVPSAAVPKPPPPGVSAVAEPAAAEPAAPPAQASGPAAAVPSNGPPAQAGIWAADRQFRVGDCVTLENCEHASLNLVTAVIELATKGGRFHLRLEGRFAGHKLCWVRPKNMQLSP